MLFLAVKVNVSFQAQSQLSIHVLHQKLHTLPMLHFQCSHFALDPRVLRSAQARTLLCHGSCIVLCHCSVDIHMCHMQGPHVLPPVFTERRARSTNCLSKAEREALTASAKHGPQFKLSACQNSVLQVVRFLRYQQMSRL